MRLTRSRMTRTLYDMNMIPPLFRRFLPVLCLFVPAVLLAAGYEPETIPEGPSGPQRRSVGLFTRLFNSPSKTNAVEQLALAKKLEADGQLKRAMKAYKAAFLFFQTSPQAPEALQSYARLLQKTRHYSQSFEEYQYLVGAYSGRFPYEDVIQTQYALANEVRTETYARWFFGIGFISPERAIPLYYQVASNAPNATLAPEALMNAGAIYQQKRQYDEAISTYADLQTRYPATDEAKEAAFQMIQCMMAIARNQPNNTQHTLNTRAALAQHIKDHPDSPHVADLRENIAFLDERQAKTLLDRGAVYEKARKKEIAADIYRQLITNFPDSPHAETARLRLGLLHPKTNVPQETKP
jgi:outer membrane protein assembly factor BamD (BamD/ComL family)